MPYTLRKMRNKKCYRVYNKSTKRVFSKCSPKTQAKRQLRLLRAIHYKNFIPTKNRK